MAELGELEKRAEEISRRGVRIVAVSNDGLEETRATQEDFPSLTILADADLSLARAFRAVHEGVGRGESRDALAPTTILVDGGGVVRWVFRPDAIFERLAVDRLVEEVERHLVRTDG